MRDNYWTTLKDFSTAEVSGILEPTRSNADLPKLRNEHIIFDMRDHLNV